MAQKATNTSQAKGTTWNAQQWGAAISAVGAIGGFFGNVYASHLQYRAQIAQANQLFENAAYNLQASYRAGNAKLDELSFNEGVLSRMHNEEIANIELAYAANGISDTSQTSQAIMMRSDLDYATNLETLRKSVWDNVTEETLTAKQNYIQARKDANIAKKFAKHQRRISNFNSGMSLLGSLAGSAVMFGGQKQ